MTMQQTELEKAQAVVAKLQAEATATKFSTLDNTGKTFEDSLELVSYKGEPTIDTNSGKQIERIPIEVLASFVGSIMGSKFSVNAGKKYVNITRA